MTGAERRKLVGYYRSLNGIERNLRELASRGQVAVDASVGDAIAEEIDRLETEFPALGPPARVRELRQRRDGPFYLTEPLLTKVSLILGRLSAAQEEDASTPVTEAKEFKFVRDSALRTILERDYLEIQRAYVARCWKSAIILAGGAIEAVLLDLVLQDPARARSSVKAPNQAGLDQVGPSGLDRRMRGPETCEPGCGTPLLTSTGVSEPRSRGERAPHRARIWFRGGAHRARSAEHGPPRSVLTTASRSG